MKCWSVFVCLVLSAPICAKEKNTKAASTVETSSTKVKVSIPELRKMQMKLQDYRFLSLNFEQTVYKNLRKKTVKNNGQVYFKKPSSFHWKFSQEDKEEWIFDGTTLLNYFPSKSYAYRYKATAAIGKNLREVVSMVLDFDALLKRYDVDSSSREKKLVVLGLLPKISGEITKVQLTLDVEKNYLKEVKLDFEGGNYSIFAFSNPKRVEVKDSFSVSPKVKITDPI